MFNILFLPAVLLCFFTKLALKQHLGHLIWAFLLHFFAIFEGLKSQK